MLRYSDCYPGCGGEDCACCEIHADHQYEMRHPRDPRDMDDYDIYGNSRVPYEEEEEEEEEDDDE